MHAAALALGVDPVAPPRGTAFGALVNYICHADAKNFQPANITFDLLLHLDEETKRRVRDKKQRHAMVCERALAEVDKWLAASNTTRPALPVQSA
jgi:methylenetetrahydrofolate--tRNA-(uracil-5-)-methyltransferase